MKRIFLIIVLCIVTGYVLFAVPAKRVASHVVQADGTVITVWLYGDEFVHFYVTSDNVPVIRDDSSFYYADVYADRLYSSGILAHEKDMRTERETNFCNNCLEKVWEWVQNKHRSLKVRSENKMAPSFRGSTPAPNCFSGNFKGLVLLVNFGNLSMSSVNPQHEFYLQFNQAGYSRNNHIGSVSDYFYDQSYGAFKLDFDVIGPLTLSRDYEYYGNNKDNDNDAYPATMVAEACRLADEYVNFGDYDWNGDGVVEQVFVVYAGYGESEGASPSTIWPHKSTLSGHAGFDGEGALLLDGVLIDTYACTCELAGNNGAIIDGIGTACHEFSHCLGLPDLYDVGYKGGVGMSYWDIMDNGSRNGPNRNGEVPCGYSAFERYLLGWMELEELDTPCRVENMPCLGDEGIAYVIYNDGCYEEFYVIENRQPKGWFSFVSTTSAHGMLVVHVDYNEKSWERNSVNTNRTHQRMSFVPADNSYGIRVGDKSYMQTVTELQGDLFPGSGNVTFFTNRSHADAGGTLFNMNIDGTYYLNKPIDNIVENNALISFDFMGGEQLHRPIMYDVCDVTANSFRAVWAPVECADMYTIEIVEVSSGEYALRSMLLSESFSKFKAYADSTNCKQDFGGRMDEFTMSPSWKGYNVRASPLGVEIGNGRMPGYLKTPNLHSNGHGLTVKFTACAAYGGKVEVVLENSNEEILSLVEQDLNMEMNNYVVTFDRIESGDYVVKVSTRDVISIGGISVYDGIFSLEDMNFTIGGASNVSRAIIEYVTDTCYLFDGLDSNCYKVRIKAHRNSLSSDWSSYVYVKLDAILGIADKFPVSTDCCEYYSLTGVRIMPPSSPGVYIRRSRYKIEKIYIK